MAVIQHSRSMQNKRPREDSTPDNESTANLLPLKSLKLLLLLALVGITIWQCVLNIQEYLNHEAVTTVSKEEADSIEFPQVTICNYNRWKASLLTPEAISVAQAAYAKANGQNTSFTEKNIDVYNFTYDRGWHMVDRYTKITFSRPRYTTLATCSFSGQYCNTKFFRHRMTSYGNCYTFNKNLTAADVQGTGLSLPLTQVHASETNGFDAYISIEADDYSEIPATDGSPFLGVKVIVHSKYDYPDPNTSGVSIGPGFYATIALRRTEYNNLPPPEGACIPQKQLEYFDAYTKSACEAECKINYVEQNCSCRPYFYPPGNKTCNWEDTLGCSSRIIAAINKNFSTFCDCPDPCTYEEFTTSVTYAPFPSRSYGNELVRMFGLSNISILQKNLVGIKVYFADISSTVITQSPAHTILSTLNDLGGTSGLYIGFSFVTFIELAQVIAELIQMRLLAKKNAVSQDTNSVPSIRKVAFN